MFSKLNKLISRGIAALINISMLLSLFSIYTISASAEEEYDRPWLWPVPGSYQINSVDTYTDGSIHNQGQALDIGSNGYRGNQRLDVISATDGTVHYIQKSYNESTNKGSGWGNYVVIKTADFYIVYAHLQTVSCKYGEIKAGDVIGKMGTTGNSTGVHLHMQAYPVGKSSNSTDIYVFDKFIYNPIYAPKFRFWAGLHKHSIRYGDIIKSYYKNIEDTYYTYSGGRELGFDSKSLGAEVTAIRVAGTRVYSQPITTSNVVRTVENGTLIKVYGYYVDAYGKIWYRLSKDSETEWVCETEVGFKDYVFNTEYENVFAPDGTYGSFNDLHFDGILTSRNTIEKVKARIVRDENVISECEIEVNARTYDINNAFFDNLAVENMANGRYTYEIIVSERASFPGADPKTSSYLLFSSDFIINSQLTDTVPPLMENIVINEITMEEVKLSAVVTDNLNVSSVTFTFKSADGTFEKTFDADLDDIKYFISVNVSELAGGGTYVVTGKATDSYGNTDTNEITITIPVKAPGELWIVTDADPSLRIRSGPGTGYAKLGSLYNGDKLFVTEIVYANGHAWGKFDAGWTALTYCTYNSGNLYSVTLNLCGGSAEMDTVISKRHDVAIAIPNVVPTRSGYKFLGWSTSLDSDTVSYKQGASYSANASAQLYAVWADSTNPAISGVSSSVSGWTSDSVNVLVNASDDSGIVFYTFDGGKSWRRSNYITVFENTVFNIGDIGVKDPSGNTVYYNVKYEVGNIDVQAPVMPESKPVATVNGSEVSLSFDKATDAVSGIKGYKLTYSLSPEFVNSVTVDIIEGASVKLDDGVYYAKLVAYDNAGNTSSILLDRFLVGEAKMLNSPSSFKISSSSSTETVFVWDSVVNADVYTVLISLNEDMSSPVSYETSTNFITISGLEAGVTYHAVVRAGCSDGVYADSEPSEVIAFVTVSNDSSIYGMKDYTDATVNGNTIRVTLHNHASEFNMEVIVHEAATVEYFNDIALTSKITVLKESFTTLYRTVYVKVIAEDGSHTVYELKAFRADQAAQAPIVVFSPENAKLFVNDCYSSVITASVSDGGIISVVWYAEKNGSEPYVIGEGSTVEFSPTAAGTYFIYAVVTNTNNKCDDTTASITSEKTTLTVSRKASSITVNVNSKPYDGMTVTPSFGEYVGDGNVYFKFFTDSNCLNEIESPVNAGKYYVKAFADQTNEYEYAESAALEFIISKAEYTAPPTLLTIMPVLRDRHGYVTVKSNGVEYSLNGGSWSIVSLNATLTFAENDVVVFRVAETDNYLASESVSVTIVPFEGTDSFIPNGSIGMTETNDGYLLVDAHKLTASVLISGLEKTENIYVTDSNGNELTGYVYSSCVIIIKDEIGVYKSLTIVILGDLDLDGVVTAQDKLQILELSNGVSVTDNALVRLAADVDRDGRITSIDSFKAHERSK